MNEERETVSSDHGGNIAVVRQCFLAWDRKDPEGVLANYAKNVEVDASRVAEGVVQGRTAVLSYYREIFESLSFANEGLELHSVEDPRPSRGASGRGYS